MSFFHPKDTASQIRNSLLFIAIAVGLFFFSRPTDSGPRWTLLLTGDSFEDWTFDVLDNSPANEIYSLEDGILTVNGAGRSNAVIRSPQSYENFELSFEWRWTGSPSNTGCLLFCSTPRHMNVWPQSLEVQLASGNAGDFIYIGETVDVAESQLPVYDPVKEKWKERLRLNMTDDSEKPIGKWNRALIISKNGEVTVQINGVLVNRGWNASASAGAICFQAEGGDLQYRHIRIRERKERS